MSFLLERDTLNGASGKAFITMDGQIKELFGAKKVQTQAEISSTDMKVIGTRKIQQKPNGAKLSGTGNDKSREVKEQTFQDFTAPDYSHRTAESRKKRPARYSTPGTAHGGPGASRNHRSS